MSQSRRIVPVVTTGALVAAAAAVTAAMWPEIQRYLKIRSM
jgi:hypothetical protein